MELRDGKLVVGKGESGWFFWISKEPGMFRSGDGFRSWESAMRAGLEAFRTVSLTRRCFHCQAQFEAKRITQQYCSQKCADFYQRQAKRNWWTAKGTEWRKNRKQLVN